MLVVVRRDGPLKYVVMQNVYLIRTFSYVQRFSADHHNNEHNPRGLGFDSHLTGVISHASKPMEHGSSGDLIRGSSSGVRPKSQCDAVGSN